MNKELLKEQIKRHEGEVLEIYEDSLGYLTFGVGHLVKEDDPEYGQPVGTPVLGDFNNDGVVRNISYTPFCAFLCSA